MQTEELFRIWDRFDRSDTAEFLYETKEGRLMLKKQSASSVRTAGQTVMPADAEFPAVPQESDRETASHRAAGTENSGTEPDSEVRAPLVGTFYRAASPESDPYVRIGQEVRRGDVIGIIEAMKLMNEITAPCSGVVEKILVEDETMVEYGQVLMQIREKKETCSKEY